MNRTKCLSDFWRLDDLSDDRVAELASVLTGSDSLIGVMGSGVRATWSINGQSETWWVRTNKGQSTEMMVFLDYSPLRELKPPFDGQSVDEVIGYAAHEGGHCLWSEPDKPQNIYLSMKLVWPTLPRAFQRAWNEGNNHPVDDGEGGTINPMLIELCRIQNILEDAYIDTRVAKQWEVLGEHIHISRQKLQERRPFDFEAIARQRTPDRNDVLNLWISVALYGTDLPKRMSAKVRRAMTGLLQLTSRAIATHSGRARHGMAVDAAAILFKEFPTFQTPPEAQSQGPTGGQASGAGGGAGGSGEKSEPGDGSGSG
ncbi:hypothetical protein LCGC14_2790720, partial [marine sediment metagenome]